MRWEWASGAGFGAIAAAVGCWSFYYFSQPSKTKGVREVSVDVPIRQIGEEVFDHHDNLFVFFLDRPEELRERNEDILKVARRLKEEKSLFRLTYYYNARKEGDPPVPDGSGPEQQDGSKPPLRCVLYKGQRKEVLRVAPDAVQLEPIKEFFAPKSEKVRKEHRELAVPRVSGETFPEDVMMGSNPNQPVLLQMYEDTCFLCFLMRPFINSVAKMLKEHGVPLRIMRLNIEKNDFPDFCPVARGTPTFVMFRGEGVYAEKWDEFKPKELTERLTSEFGQFLPQKILEQLEEFQGLVSKRFQFFTQLVMWTIELQKLEAIISAAPSAGGAPAQAPAAEGGDEEESTFSTLVSQMMLKDMKRTDMLLENIEYLQNEIDEVEHDCALLGITLAERVMAGEAAEEAMSKAKSKWF